MFRFKHLFVQFMYVIIEIHSVYLFLSARLFYFLFVGWPTFAECVCQFIFLITAISAPRTFRLHKLFYNAALIITAF